MLRWSGAETVYFMALRSPDAGAFERRALEGLELYLPHLHQAVALAERLGSLASDKVRRLQELVGEAQGAIMVLDGDQKVIAASPAAETLLVRGRLSRSGRRGQHLAHDRDHESHGRPLTRALQVANGTVVDGFQPPGPDLDEHTSVIPLPAGSLPGQDRPAVAVMSDDRLPNEERLRQTNGLTPAEARLALRLARGLSVQEAAKRLEIAITTARTHLQRVYGKTHTCRQSELVELLLGGQKRPE